MLKKCRLSFSCDPFSLFSIVRLRNRSSTVHRYFRRRIKNHLAFEKVKNPGILWTFQWIEQIKISKVLKRWTCYFAKLAEHFHYNRSFRSKDNNLIQVYWIHLHFAMLMKEKIFIFTWWFAWNSFSVNPFLKCDSLVLQKQNQQ